MPYLGLFVRVGEGPEVARDQCMAGVAVAKAMAALAPPVPQLGSPPMWPMPWDTSNVYTSG
jgi:hypothetical protein